MRTHLILELMGTRLEWAVVYRAGLIVADTCTIPGHSFAYMFKRWCMPHFQVRTASHFRCIKTLQVQEEIALNTS
jgi:5,10-methenyltetrahydromethanopterin hydrogenase